MQAWSWNSFTPGSGSFKLYSLGSGIQYRGKQEVITPLLLGLTTMAGLFAAINWLRAKDELNGRPYWMLGTASLAIACCDIKPPICMPGVEHCQPTFWGI